MKEAKEKSHTLGNKSWCFVQNGKTLASAKQVVEVLEGPACREGNRVP